MQVQFKFVHNFTQQLKFLAIILGATVVILGSDRLYRPVKVIYFSINCIALSITGLLFITTMMDMLKHTENLLKFERIFAYIIGILIAIMGIVIISTNVYYEPQAILSGVLGLVFVGPLYILLGWQLTGASERDPENFKPLYISLSISSTPVRFIEDIIMPPPKYSESIRTPLRHNVAGVHSGRTASPSEIESA